MGLPPPRALVFPPPAATPVQVDLVSSLRLVGRGAETNIDRLLLRLRWQVKRQARVKPPLLVGWWTRGAACARNAKQFARFGTAWMVNWMPNDPAAVLVEVALPSATAITSR